MTAPLTRRAFTRLALTTMGAATMASLAGCATADAAPAATAGGGTAAAKLRLGYFDNVTHATALIGLQQGLLAKSLGTTTLTTEIFNAGPATVEALSAGAIDAAFIGPSPAISSYAASAGKSIRIIAGATNGGAALVVKKDITKASQLKGTTLASPQLGNTQDVALRTWLAEQGLTTSLTGGGDVTITPTDNAQTLTLFQQGAIDGAWLPEPWVSRLVLDAGGHVLVNEASQWPGGRFPSTVLVADQSFIDAHGTTIDALVKGHAASIAWLGAHSAAEAATAINARLTKDSGKGLETAVIERALTQVTFSLDPVASTFPELQRHAVKLGLSKSADLHGIFDLRAANALLKAAGKPTVSAGGLGV
ncbi:ABC transporter substrate-binding protein [Humibacter ginsenosidimutans]|uniref:ABC transporter substrate-binding protein n=2 Tax=Humibacter ginsenosidimutans TaxID=2599293 RepID=A0A5B8M8C8_9MICO|nr:ABC transporter substrate-binding protein [Humibacter ginsenosidimutans]